MARRPKIGKAVVYTTDTVLRLGEKPSSLCTGVVESIDRNITTYDKDFYYYIKNEDTGKMDVVKSKQILDYVKEDSPVEYRIQFGRPIEQNKIAQ